MYKSNRLGQYFYNKMYEVLDLIYNIDSTGTLYTEFTIFDMSPVE